MIVPAGLAFSNFVIMAIVLIVLWVLLNRTVQGQHIKAIGVSPETSRRAGIAVDRSRIVTFAVAGTCAAITGILGPPPGVTKAPERTGETQRSCVDASKAKREGLWQLRTALIEGLRRTSSA